MVHRPHCRLTLNPFVVKRASHIHCMSRSNLPLKLTSENCNPRFSPAIGVRDWFNLVRQAINYLLLKSRFPWFSSHKNWPASCNRDLDVTSYTPRKWKANQPLSVKFLNHVRMDCVRLQSITYTSNKLYSYWLQHAVGCFQSQTSIGACACSRPTFIFQQTSFRKERLYNIHIASALYPLIIQLT